MKRIAIYDRYKLDNGEIPELHGIMIVDCKRKIPNRENELVGDGLVHSKSIFIPP